MGPMPARDPDALLADLDPAQREAVTITSGRCASWPAPGRGKTRVISRRVAYALATGVVRPRDVLVVTFTDKAAGEMREPAGGARPSGRDRLHVPRRRAPSAPPFLAARPRQRPAVDPRVEGADPRARSRPGCPAATATSRSATSPPRSNGRRRAGSARPSTSRGRIAEDRDALAAARPDGGPLPPLRGGQGAGRPDRLRGHARADDRADRGRRRDRRARSAIATAGSRSTSTRTRTRSRPRLLDAWLGGREDLAVVGDEDQTIYTFTGATSDYLIGFATRYPTPGSCGSRPTTARRPRSSASANRVLAAGRAAPDERRPGSRPAAAEAPRREPRRQGPSRRSAASRPTRRSWPAMTAAIRALARAGTAHGAMAILVRTNAQLPAIEGALGAAGIPFHVRGERFFARPEVRRAMRGRPAPSPASTSEDAARRRDWRPHSSASSASAATRSPTARPPPSATARSSRSSNWPRTWSGRIRPRTSPAFLAEVERRTAIEAGGDGDRRRAPDLPPGQGARVGRGLPARARGRHAADPPGDRTRRAGRGATPALRRDHPGAALPVAVVGDRRDGGDRARRPAQPLAVPRWARCRRRPGAVAESRRSRRSWAGATAARPKVDPADRSPLSNALRAWRTARARADAVAAVHRLPRLDDRGHRGTPSALDRGAAPRPRRRSDEARPLRRGDHRRRGPRRLTRTPRRTRRGPPGA